MTEKPIIKDGLQFGSYVIDSLGNREILVKYWMDEIEVDGVRRNRFVPHQRQQPMIQPKDELSINGFPQDTGHAMSVSFNLEMSEDHWLRCGRFIYLGERCGECSEIAER
jgi:hypothetical protein